MLQLPAPHLHEENILYSTGQVLNDVSKHKTQCIFPTSPVWNQTPIKRPMPTKCMKKDKTKCKVLAQIIRHIHPGNGQTEMLHRKNLLGIFSNMAIKGEDYHLNLMYIMYLRTQVKCKPPKCQVQH